MESEQIEEEVIVKVENIIKEISYKGAEVSTPMSALEGKIVHSLLMLFQGGCNSKHFQLKSAESCLRFQQAFLSVLHCKLFRKHQLKQFCLLQLPLYIPEVQTGQHINLQPAGVRDRIREKV